MEEFDAKMESMNCTAREAINMVNFGNFSLNDDYFGFDGYNNLISFTKRGYECIKYSIIKQKIEEILDDYYSRTQNS